MFRLARLAVLGSPTPRHTKNHRFKNGWYRRFDHTPSYKLKLAPHPQVLEAFGFSTTNWDPVNDSE